MCDSPPFLAVLSLSPMVCRYLRQHTHKAKASEFEMTNLHARGGQKCAKHDGYELQICCLVRISEAAQLALSEKSSKRVNYSERWNTDLRLVDYGTVADKFL